MNEAPAVRKAPPQATSSGSIHTLMTSRQPYMSEPIASKHVCFYKSGDAQFSGLPVVINNRTFKTFEALLDSLSKRVPLPFGVRTITTPRGHTTVRSLDQLHHGQSYICSDKRTVKPIDLERARRKPPPWYHAWPVSARRMARERQSPGQHGVRRARRKEHAVLLHTPRRLVVFRNGDPEVKHTLLLQKRTTQSFEALLELVSEVMRFAVLKLHTPDGRRVDGLPALILCSGVLVAAGREPFRKGNYDVQKPSAPTWLPAKSVGRLRPVSQKKKLMASSTKSRPFSPSSEHYIVNQIHNSLAGSACDYPSNPTGSVEMEAGQLLESVTETDPFACLDGDGEGDIRMPTEDDIEKSFRVNQDGSMTVEMKVRLTLKEAETIHWTTTLSRSSVASQTKAFSELHPDLDAHLSDITPDIDSESSMVITNSREEIKGSTELMDVGGAEEILTVQEPLQLLPSTPGWRKVEQKQSIGSTMKVTDTEIQQSVLASYAYRGEASNGEMKQEHCMVQQCRSRPVPKPRTNRPSELNATSQMQSDTYPSGGNGEEVHETVLHIYEQQTCQENFFANTQLGIGTCAAASGQPTSSGNVVPGKTVCSSGEDFESELRTMIAYGSLKTQDNLFKPDHHTLCKIQTPHEMRSSEPKMCTHESVTEPSEPRATSTADTSKRRKPVRVIMKKNHIFKITAPERKQNDNKIDTLKEVQKIRADIFSRSGKMRHTEHYRAKAAHKLLKKRNNQGGLSSLLRSPVQVALQSPKDVPAEKQQSTTKIKPAQANCLYETPNEGSGSPKKYFLHASINKCTLTRQTSMHEERDFQRETRELSESISLPALHSSSSVFNEYVELWLQKSQPESTNKDLQDYASFVTSLEAQSSLEVSEITCETTGDPKTSKEALPCCVSQDHASSSSNPSLTKSSVQEIKETLCCNPERIVQPINSSGEKMSKRESVIIKESPQSNTVQEIPLQRHFSMKKQWNNNISPEDNCLQNGSLSEEKSKVSGRETSPVKNVTVNHTSSNDNSAPSELLVQLSKLPSNQETVPVPRNLKRSSQSKQISAFETNPDETSTGDDQVKQVPRKLSSEKAPLPNQPSVEKIPKNNTLTKASLFKRQNVENTPLSTKLTSVKKLGTEHSSLMNVYESKRNVLGKSQERSDVTKPDEIQERLLPLGDVSTSQPTKRTSSLPNEGGQIMTGFQAEKSYVVKMAVRPDMRHVLEELCHSIQSLREVMQHKQRSCLERSKSMPDFSSHLASTFGSPSWVLIAFLSVMTLKDGLANLNACRQAQDNLSCSEALLMLQSLKETAAMEDAERLRTQLNALQNSTSVQLLQSWKGFQELSNISRSRWTSLGPLGSSYSGSCSEKAAIQGLMEDLGVPDRVREELAALCTLEESIRGNQIEGLEKQSESLTEVKMNGFREPFLKDKTITFPDCVLDDVNIYVKSVIEKAVKAHLEDCGSSDFSMGGLLTSAEKEITVIADKHEKELSQIKRSKQAKCVPDFDPGLNEPTLKENQQTTEEREVVVVRHEGQQIDAKSGNNVNENEVVEEWACEQTCTKANYIIDEISKCTDRETGSDEGTEAVKKMEEKNVEDDGITELDPKTFASTNSNERVTSGEMKFSLEEDGCSDEEAMSFPECQLSDKDENLQISSTEVRAIDKTNAITASFSLTQSEGQGGQAQTHLHCTTDCERTGPHKIIRPHIHIESQLKEDITQHDTEHQHKIVHFEEKQVVLDPPECYTIYQEHFAEKREHRPEETELFSEKKKNSVAELISNLESVTQRDSNKPKKPVDALVAHTDVLNISDADDLTDVSQISNEQDSTEEFLRDPSKVRTHDKRESKKQSVSKQSHTDLTSEPLSSSLAFSYDSRSSSLAQEPEGSIQANRVKSIREMFIVKSNPRTQNRQGRQHSPNSDMSDHQTESSDSGVNQSRTSPEASSEEDDSSRLTIAKGFVRRTIERLYGRGHSNSTGLDAKRAPSASKVKQKEGPGRTNVSTLASFHEAQTRAKTDLSYFNARSSLDILNEPAHCVTLSAQVESEDAVLIDKGRWLLRENQPIHESSPDLQEMPKKETKNIGMFEDPDQDAMKEDAPYSLFCPASPYRSLPSTDVEDVSGSSGLKFTYFNLPNASDSELEPEGQHAETLSKREAKVTPVTESPKSWAEKNSILPAFNPPVIKRADNKVHPLLEARTPPVVTQPARGQSAPTEVARRSTEPDVIEMLFVFCGQHCPIL